MDRQCHEAIKALKFLDTLFPEDDEKRKEVKASFKDSIAKCEALLVESAEEEEAAHKATKTTEVRREDVRDDVCPPLKRESKEEDYEAEISTWKKEKLLEEAVKARDSLKMVMEEVEAHLKALLPSDKVEIIAGKPVITHA